MNSYEEKYQGYLAEIDHALDRLLAQTGAPYQSVVDAMRYSVLGAGKRIRAIVLLEFCELCGGTREDAMPFACALEMIHAYSLVHDDLPCMDNDELRRGKPSCWKQFGETTALLAGDALLTTAFEAASTSTVEPARAIRAVAELAACAGCAGMLGGQVIDLGNEGKPVSEELLLQMYAQKTGALLCGAAKIGCIVAGADAKKIKLAQSYAQKIGLAFQIVDDILDVSGNYETLGKPIGSDAENAKTTYATLHTLDCATEKARELTAQAKNSLCQFVPKDTFLLELTDRLAVRES